jgi:hypothetical protein
MKRPKYKKKDKYPKMPVCSVSGCLFYTLLKVLDKLYNGFFGEKAAGGVLYSFY